MNKIRFFTFALCFEIMLLSFSGTSLSQTVPHQAGKTVTIAIQHDPVKHPMGSLLNKIYTEAFRRLGYNMIIKHSSTKRVSVYANEGVVDGEIARVKDYGKHFPNLIRVDEPAIYINFVAYALNPDIQLNGWESLRGTDYRVNYRRGAKGPEVQLSKIFPERRIEAVNTNEQGFRKLLAKRIDIFVNVERPNVLKTEEFRNIRIAGVMEEVSVHAYLHRKNKELVPKLSAELKKMREEGVLDQLR